MPMSHDEDWTENERGDGQGERRSSVIPAMEDDLREALCVECLIGRLVKNRMKWAEHAWRRHGALGERKKDERKTAFKTPGRKRSNMTNGG